MLAATHSLVIQTDCQQHCTSSEEWLLSSISSDGAESANPRLFIYIRMSWWDFFKCTGRTKNKKKCLNTLAWWSHITGEVEFLKHFCLSSGCFPTEQEYLTLRSVSVVLEDAVVSELFLRETMMCSAVIFRNKTILWWLFVSIIEVEHFYIKNIYVIFLYINLLWSLKCFLLYNYFT